MRQLRGAGPSADEVRAGLAELDVRPVLTAHPTESTRRTLLALQARVAELLDGVEGLVALEPADDTAERGGEAADVVVERDVFGAGAGVGQQRRLRTADYGHTPSPS